MFNWPALKYKHRKLPKKYMKWKYELSSGYRLGDDKAYSSSQKQNKFSRSYE